MHAQWLNEYTVTWPRTKKAWSPKIGGNDLELVQGSSHLPVWNGTHAVCILDPKPQCLLVNCASGDSIPLVNTTRACAIGPVPYCRACAVVPSHCGMHLTLEAEVRGQGSKYVDLERKWRARIPWGDIRRTCTLMEFGILILIWLTTHNLSLSLSL